VESSHLPWPPGWTPCVGVPVPHKLPVPAQQTPSQEVKAGTAQRASLGAGGRADPIEPAPQLVAGTSGGGIPHRKDPPPCRATAPARNSSLRCAVVLVPLAGGHSLQPEP
jgi:hypothetical protein